MPMINQYGNLDQFVTCKNVILSIFFIHQISFTNSMIISLRNSYILRQVSFYSVRRDLRIILDSVPHMFTSVKRTPRMISFKNLIKSTMS